MVLLTDATGVGAEAYAIDFGIPVCLWMVLLSRPTIITLSIHFLRYHILLLKRSYGAHSIMK